MGDELPLLGARSSVTGLPDVLVRRPRLDVLLADRARRSVTLVSAPPGSGKTTLVTAWFTARRRRDVVPVTVDARDNERGQLAGVIAAALVARGALAVGDVDARLPGTDLVDALFTAVEQRGQRLVLVLDDVQELTSPDALHTLAYLLERAPRLLDVIVCSRADPPVRLNRLRLQGRLGEIRYRDLAFDLAETTMLLEAHGLRLTRGQVQALWRRTEGWVAGLRLAACALQGEADPAEFVQSAAGTESAIADYLLRELFARQDERVQQFMLRTSVVARLTPELARELTDAPAVEALLDQLVRNGVFLAELEDRTWYRYHSLFASLLEARLRHHHRDLADELHRRAAVWFLANEMPEEAESHARAAGDWPMVGRLASGRWVGRVLNGAELSDDLLAGVPPRAISTSEGLVVLAAAATCSGGDRLAADSWRTALDGLAPHPEPPRAASADGSAAGATSALARPLVDIGYARMFGADTRARQAVVRLHEAARAGGGAVIDQVADLRTIGFDLEEGHVERARRRASELARSAESTWIGCDALAVVALVEAVEGGIVAATRHGERALDHCSPARATVRCPVSLAQALCHALRGEHRRALDDVATAEPPRTADRWLRAVDRAVRTALGTPGSGVVGLEADEAAHPLAARALVALGVLETVDASGRVRIVGGPLEEDVLLARQRWLAHDAAGVVAALDRPLVRGLAACHPRTLVERWTLLALATAERGDVEMAVAALCQALLAADRTGIRAPLLVLSRDLTGLLEAHADDLGHQEAMALELIDRAHTSPAPAFMEPLTDRESAVLRHLPTLMSNHEIASVMHVSVNTVKTHLKSLYRKLGVASRREAVLRGRALELV